MKQIIVSIVFATVSFTAFATQAESMTCYSEDLAATLSFAGELSKKTTVHPNGTEFTSYVIALDPTFCFIEDVSAGSVKTQISQEAQINIANLSAEKVAMIEQSVGKRLIVEGSFFIGHTAWHVSPIVVMAQDVGMPD